MLLSQNVPVFENIGELRDLPDRGFEVIALPMKISGGTGGPLHVIAVLPQRTSRVLFEHPAGERIALSKKTMETGRLTPLSFRSS